MSDRDLTIRIGQGAQRILSDDVATMAVESVLDDIKGAWLRSRPDDIQGREASYRMVLAVQLLVSKLQALRDAGLKAAQDTQHESAEAKGQSAYH